MDRVKQIALISGGNKGLGFETAVQLSRRGIKVFLGSRSEQKGRESATRLQSAGFDVTYIPLEVTDAASIQAAVDKIGKEFGHLDILINNAGVLLERGDGSLPIHTDKDILLKTFETNVAGAYMLCDAVLPLMRQNGYGRIVNVSSGMGQLANMQSEFPAYRISKTALNAVTKIFATLCRGINILVNSVCPGWVKTDMGGAEAPRSLAAGVETIVWAATLEDGSLTGNFFRDKHSIPW